MEDNRHLENMDRWAAMMNADTMSRRRLLKLAAASGGVMSATALFGALTGSSAGASSLGGSGKTLNSFFGPGGTAAGKGLTIRTGMALAMSGAGAYYGQIMSQGSLLAAKQVEEAGGPTFAISIIDHDNGNVTVGITGLHKLIDLDNISLLLSSYGAVSDAFVPIVAANNILGTNGGGADPAELYKNLWWCTRTIFGWDNVPPGLEYLHKTYPDAKRLAVLDNTENAYVGTHIEAPQVWKKLVPDGDFLEITVPIAVTDFTSTVAQVRAWRPDVTFNTSPVPDVGYLVKQLCEGGVLVPHMGCNLDSQVSSLIGSWQKYYIMCMEFFNLEDLNPLGEFFATTYKAAYRQEPDPNFSANYYDQVTTFWDCTRWLVNHGGMDPNSGAHLQTALKAVNNFKTAFSGTKTQVGTYGFDLQSHAANRDMAIVGLRNSQPYNIETVPWQELPSKAYFKTHKSE